jgi:Leucine-rich repeat (LRR) protein
LLRDISLHVSLPDNTSSVSEDDTVESNPKSRLMFASLSMLDMSNNSVRLIPTFINELNNLSVFNISGNTYVTDLPPEMGLLNRLWNLNTRYGYTRSGHISIFKPFSVAVASKSLWLL